MARGRYEKRLKSPLGHQHKNALKCVNTVTFNYPRAKRTPNIFKLLSTNRVLSFMQQLNGLNRTIFVAKIQINYGFNRFNAHNFTQNPLANVFFNY